jgi:hypothetical protein
VRMKDSGGGAAGRRRALTLLAVVLASGGCQDLLNAVSDGGASDDTGAAGSGGSASVPGCGLPNEPEPNDSRDRATPYQPGSSVTGCMVSADDVDYLEFRSPADPAGGYYQIAVTDVGAGRIEIQTFSAADNGRIDRWYTDDTGASLFGFFAAAPGQTYRIAVAALPPFTAGFRYTLRASYTRIDDGYEPNDSREAAKPITLGTAIQAFMFAGHQSSTVQSNDFADWYAFTLPAGMVNVRVDDVPSNVRIEGLLYDADGSQVDAPRMSNDNGASFDVTTRVLNPGLHRLSLGTFPPTPLAYGKGTTLPENFSHPYKLTVSPR